MGYSREDKLYEFEGRIEAQTAKAYLIEFTNNGEEMWVPKSQIRGEPEATTPGRYMFTLTEWIAKKNGLVD